MIGNTSIATDWANDLSQVNQSVDNAFHKDLLVFANFLSKNSWNPNIDEEFCDNFRKLFASSNIRNVDFDDDTISEIYNQLKREAIKLKNESNDTISTDALLSHDIVVLKKFLKTKRWDKKCSLAYNELQSYSSNTQFQNFLSEVDSAKQNIVSKRSDNDVDILNSREISSFKMTEILDEFADDGLLIRNGDYDYSIGSEFGDNEKSIDMLKTITSIMKGFGKVSNDNIKYFELFANKLFSSANLTPYLKSAVSPMFKSALQLIVQTGKYTYLSYTEATTRQGDSLITHDCFAPYIGTLLNSAEGSFLPCGILKLIDDKEYVIASAEKIQSEFDLNAYPYRRSLAFYLANNFKTLSNVIEANLNSMIPEFSNRNIIKSSEYEDVFTMMSTVFNKYIRLFFNENFYFLLDTLGCADLKQKFMYDGLIYFWCLLLHELNSISEYTEEAIDNVFIPALLNKFDIHINPKQIYNSSDDGTCAADSPRNEYESYINNISSDLYNIIHYIHNPVDSFEKYFDSEEDVEGNLTYYLTDETLESNKDIHQFIMDVSKRIAYLRKYEPKNEDLRAIRTLLYNIDAQVFWENAVSKDNKAHLHYLAYGEDKYRKIISDALSQDILIKNNHSQLIFNPKKSEYEIADIRNRLQEIIDNTGWVSEDAEHKSVKHKCLPSFSDMRNKIFKILETAP